MKNYNLFLKGIFVFIFLNTLAFCTKDSITEVIDTTNQNLDETTELTASKNAKESLFNTDARLATLYTLQYAKAVNPEFKLDPRKGNTPISIPGAEVEKYMNLDKLPLEKEEIEFIKREVLHKKSRAILLKDIYDPKNKKNVNIVYIPYPKNIEVPKGFIHQNGLLIDDLIFDWHWPWKWQRSGFKGQNWGWNCFCFYVYRPFTSWNCWYCPFIWFEYRNILDDIIIDLDIYEKPFTDPIPIEEIPLGRSLFDLAL